jgi:hypothetical protein
VALHVLVQHEHIVELCEALTQSFIICTQAEQAVCGYYHHARISNEPTVVIKHIQVFALEMRVPHPVRMALHIMLVAVVHLCRDCPLVGNVVFVGNIESEILIIVEILKATIPKALVRFHVV